MIQHKQRGSVLGYVLVGTLLVALLLGGIFVVRNNMAQLDGSKVTKEVRNTDTTKTQAGSDSDTQTASTDVATNATDETSDDIAEAVKKQAEEEKKAKEQNAAVTAQTSTQSVVTTTDSASTTLPTTGPGDAINSIVSVSLLVGAVVAYARSRATL